MGLAVHDLFYYGTLPTADLDFILQGTLPQAVEPITAGVIAFAVEILLLVRVLDVLPHPLVRWTFCALVVVGASAGLLGACMYGAIGIKWHNEDVRLGLSLGVEVLADSVEVRRTVCQLAVVLGRVVQHVAVERRGGRRPHHERLCVATPLPPRSV